MDARQERGIAIAQTQTLTQRGSSWLVPSQSNGNRYVVFPDKDNPRCTCPDHVEGQYKCKHIFAVEFKMSRTTQETDANGTTTTTTETLTIKTTAERKTYQQPSWPKYNASQLNERSHFHDFLADLCQTLPATPRKPGCGRKPISYRDGLFAAVLKVFSEKSARRFNGELEEAQERGLIEQVPHFTSVLNVFDKEEVTPLLKSMIETTSLPLQAIESDFAIDSTGFSTTTYNQWLVNKHGAPKRYAKFVKAHFCTGVKTNVVATVEIDHEHANDTLFLSPLTERTAEIGFSISEMSADAAYPSQQNFEAVNSAGGKFFPAFRSNTTGAVGGLFQKAYHSFCLNKEEYLSHYHKRSNVESTVSMIKRKFGDSVKAKNELAQKNEVYAKFVCHNLCVLIQEMYVQGIDPTFGKQTVQPSIGLKIFGTS